MTSKSGKTRVKTQKFIAIAEKLGLQVTPKAGWLLVFKPDAKERRILVHTGKRGTNCVELVGFDSEWAIKHPCPPAKTMTQMLDCDVSEKEILRAFYKTAKALATARFGKVEVFKEGVEDVKEQPAAPELTEEQHIEAAIDQDWDLALTMNVAA